jgi:hypothetical protein
VPSSQAELLVIEPGDRDRSYLWAKVNGTHRGAGGEGELMPPPDSQNDPLSQEALDALGAWIDAGAMP